jgi:hypothetical protein
MDPRRLTAACQSCAVSAAMPFPFDGIFDSDFFTFAVLGMGKVGTYPYRAAWPARPEVRLYN